MSTYRGRFAPSPTGPLHAGSLVTALASWLGARAHGGAWLVRMEDVDLPRCTQEFAREILHQLDACGMRSDEPVMVQSQRGAAYAQALRQLQNRRLAYACTCSRARIESANMQLGRTRSRFGELVYPGTCRPLGLANGPQVAWRLNLAALASVLPKKQENTPNVQYPRCFVAPYLGVDVGVHFGSAATEIAPPQDLQVQWHDARLGAQSQNVSAEVGDFVLRRSDGLWAYQLAVVTDDAAQGITHVVRGEDLSNNTPRQIALQTALQVPSPVFWHGPLVLGADGAKLAKQNGAQAVDARDPMAALLRAARVLGLPAPPIVKPAADPSAFLTQLVPLWAAREAARH